MDDVRSTFDAAVEGVPVPPGDLAAVVGRGAVRRRRRIAARVAALSTVAVVGGGLAAILGGQESRPAPAGPGDARPLGSRLVPVVMEDPSPFPELASTPDRADARAVAVAFHALLGSAPRWHLGYEGFERSDDGWRVRFVQGTPATRIERELREVELNLETTLLRAESEMLELDARAEDLLSAREEARGDKADALRRRARAVRRTAARVRAKVAQLKQQVAAIEEQQREVRGRLPSYDVVVEVAQRDGVVFVEEVTTDSPDAAALRRATGYAEEATAVDIWGYDWFQPRFRRSDGTNANVRVEVLGFWMGPLWAPYEERCRPQVRGPDGVVWTEPRPDYPPGAPDHWDRPPPSEDMRDGLARSFEVGYVGEPDDLSLRMLCEWRPRQ